MLFTEKFYIIKDKNSYFITWIFKCKQLIIKESLFKKGLSQMKISNSENKEIIKSIIKEFQTKPSVGNGSQGNSQSISKISSEITKLFSTLNDSEKNALITILFKNNLNIEPKILNMLFPLLTKNDENKNLSRIKAFSLLYKNNLPLLPKLIIPLARYLNSESSITEELKQLLETENTTNTKNNLNQETTILKEKGKVLQEQLSKLSIDITQSPEKLTTEIKKYPEILQDFLNYMDKSPEESKIELNGQILVQQLVNNFDKNLLLFIEIPIFIPNYNKLYPAFLQIRKEESENKKENINQNSLRVKFLIDLKKSGWILANALYTPNENGPSTIKINFKCSSPKSKNTMVNKIDLLETSLKNLGLKIEKIDVSLDDNTKDGKNIKGRFDDFFEESFPESEIEGNLNLKHFDFHV